MSAAAPAHYIEAAVHAPQLNRSVERLRGALLWLTGFSGAFVFMEPSPYEVCSLLTIIVFALTGLALRPTLMPLITMLTLYGFGFAVAAVQVIDQKSVFLWVLVSWYLCLSAIFFSIVLCTNTEERLRLLTYGCIAAAIVTSVIAILAYFHVFGGASETFLKYDRARGTFNDPNVLGAFLVFPGLLVLQQLLGCRFTQVLRAAVLLAVIVMALLLSFSRGAWGQFAASAVLMMFLTFVTSRSSNERARIILLAAGGMVAIALFLVALLSVDKIAELFKQRATLDQSYDLGHLGRFGRYILGALLALDHPFGIGPLQFATYFPEDPHNTYLNTFMSGGWLSGIVYVTLTLTTLILGLRYVFVATPWRPTYLAVYCAYVGVAAESAIIDTDHWRHYFLLLGVLWGLMTATRSYRPPAPQRAPRPIAVFARPAHQSLAPRR